MTEASPDDVLEQQQDVDETDETGEPTDGELPLDADPADVAEQRSPTGYPDDE